MCLPLSRLQWDLSIFMRDGRELCFSHVVAIGKSMTVGFSFIFGLWIVSITLCELGF